MNYSEGSDPINLFLIEDIKNKFGQNGVIGYIKNIEDTVLDGSTVDKISSSLIEQLSFFIKNPDKGSDFEKKIQNIPSDRSNEILIKNLFLTGYGINAKILPENEKIVSFVAYQDDTNNNLLKIFKLHTDEEYRGGKLTYDLVEGLLLKTTKDIQVGKGPSETNETNKASQKMIESYKKNGYNVDEERFIIKNNKF